MGNCSSSSSIDDVDEEITPEDIYKNDWPATLAKAGKELSLFDYQIGADRVVSLAEALKANTSLRELDLNGNEIGAEGAASLAAALKTNTSLRKLDLWGNKIGDKGAVSLAEALKANTSLQKLELGENEIGDKGAISLAEAMKWNISLRKLDLECNDNIGDIANKKVKDALRGHRISRKMSLAVANSAGLLTLPQLAAAGAYVAFVHLLRSDASGMDSVPTKDVIQLLLIAVQNKGSADAVALLELFGERIGKDIGAKVTEAQATATSNAAAGLSESILKPHAKLLALLHSDEMLPHWAAKNMEAVVAAMEKYLYPELDRASIAACKAAAEAVGPGTPGLEAAGQIVAAGNADAKGGGSSIEVYNVTWNSKVSHDNKFDKFMERCTELKDDTDVSNPGKVRNPGVSFTSMMVYLYRIKSKFLSELEKIREKVGQGVSLQFDGNKSVSFKGATRTLEKAIIKTILENLSATTIKFDSVLDGSRAMFVHDGCKVGIKVLNELDDSEVMKNARIKNRTAGTVDGWRDVLGNWFVTPENGVKPVPVEVQVVERKMLVQREQLGGHHDYGNIRSSRGLLQLAVGLKVLTKGEMEVATKSDCAMGDKLEKSSSSDIAEEVAQLKEQVEHFKLKDENTKLKDELAKLKENKVAKLEEKGNQGLA